MTCNTQILVPTQERRTKIASADAAVNTSTLEEISLNLGEQHSLLSDLIVEKAQGLLLVPDQRRLNRLSELRDEFYTLCGQRIPLDHPVIDGNLRLMSEINRFYKLLNIRKNGSIAKLVLPEFMLGSRRSRY